MHELSGTPSAITRPFMGVISTKTSAWPKDKPVVFLAGFPDNLRRLPFRPWGRGNLAACMVPAGESLYPAASNPLYRWMCPGTTVPTWATATWS